MKTTKSILVLLSATLLFTACKKQEPTPPAGVVGLSSNIYTVTPAAWGLSGLNGQEAAFITDTWLNDPINDGVEVFVSGYPDGKWMGMPASNLVQTGDYVEYLYSNQQIEIVYDGTPSPGINLYIKVVVIPPAIMKQHPNTNWKDYDQVEALIEAQKGSSN